MDSLASKVVHASSPGTGEAEIVGYSVTEVLCKQREVGVVARALVSTQEVQGQWVELCESEDCLVYTSYSRTSREPGCRSGVPG